MTSELTIDRAIGRMIKRKFPECFSWKVSDKFISGLPDRIVIMRGFFIGLEVKTENGDLAPIQVWTLVRIEESGGVTCVVRSVTQAEDFLTRIQRRVEKWQSEKIYR